MFREWLAAMLGAGASLTGVAASSSLFQVAFDSQKPVETPNGLPPTPAQGVTEVNRFAQYVISARPFIPHKRIQESPLKVALEADAKPAIYTAIKNTAGLFLSEGYTSGEADSVRKNDKMPWKIAWYFDNFLRAGLASGDAPWPI